MECLTVVARVALGGGQSAGDRHRDSEVLASKRISHRPDVNLSRRFVAFSKVCESDQIGKTLRRSPLLRVYRVDLVHARSGWFRPNAV
jgi:hypothetical protein